MSAFAPLLDLKRTQSAPARGYTRQIRGEQEVEQPPVRRAKRAAEQTPKGSGACGSIVRDQGDVIRHALGPPMIHAGADTNCTQRAFLTICGYIALNRRERTVVAGLGNADR